MPIIASCFISIGIWKKGIVKGEGIMAREGLRGEEEDSKKEVHMKKLTQTHRENNKTWEEIYKKIGGRKQLTDKTDWNGRKKPK